ncbi:MAG: lipocalin family protein [Betaproteobacteria bacterium]
MSMSRQALVLIVVLLLGPAHANAPTQSLGELTTVEKVDLNRYIGKWHEIALFPNRFQAQCVGDTTANYALKPNGRIEVTNRCRTSDGKTDVAVGEAKLAVEDGSNAKLKVRFAPAYLAWLPQVWGNYWVIELDPDYQFVVVSEPNREFLWILSRTPALGDATLSGIKTRLTARGFDIAKLQFKPHSAK